MLTDFAERLLRRLTNERNGLVRQLAEGTCPDYPAYMQLSGRCQQLASTIEVVEEELKLFQEDDES